MVLQAIYRRLFEVFGPQHWWPADSPYEMMVGALLTQATSWSNVEEAMDRLRGARLLSPSRLAGERRARLERLIRPAGYFRQKARRLQGFSRWYLRRFRGRADRMFRTPLPRLREELLAQYGVGPETADSILLYAGRRPVFVVDAYTQRVFYRHRLVDRAARYETVQELVMRALRAEERLYNELHALIVAVGKRYCHRTAPDCAHCPLGDLPRRREV